MDAGSINTAANVTVAQQPHYWLSVSPPSSASSTCSSPPPPVLVGNTSSSSTSHGTVVLSPCAACKMLRRRCADGCVLAPYFPPTDPAKFSTAHRVFGASNIIKLLQARTSLSRAWGSELPESAREDAVSSMVYEAEARARDPVYGCAGAVCRLQKEAEELKVQLARAQADLLNAQAQHANLVALVCVELAASSHSRHGHHQQLAADHALPLTPHHHPAEYGGGGAYQYYGQPLGCYDSAAWDEPRLWT
uniref:LOB domain-containing protein n=1 Tax=Leersia perrieri TaxID=77586 RepID=A0A0D9VSS0_9ORYZ